MKRIIFLLSIICLTTSVFGQDPSIDAGVDTLTCPPDCIDLVATFEGGNNTTDYTVSSITYAPDSYDGTSVFLGDDSGVTGLDIGFDFCFYGSIYSEFCISPNGWIGFGALSFSFTPVAIPSVVASTPKNAIMGPWQDLNPGIGGSVKYQTLGVAPYRRLVVTWDAVPYFNCTDLNGTQQIIIYETTNLVETHIEHKISCPTWVGGRGVQGVHNAAGTEAVAVPGRNNTVWTADDDAVRFTPSGDPVIEWYEGDLLIGEGAEITLCPEEATTYTAKLMACGVEVASDDIFIDIVCCDPPITSFTPPTCNGDCDGTATAEGVGVAPFTYLWDAAAADQTTSTAVDLCAGDYVVEVTDAEGCTTTTTITVTEPDEITADIVAVDVSCFGMTDGSITIEGIGGTGAYTYDIGAGPEPVGSYTDLVPGTYTVTIEDENGCTSDFEIVINEPDVMDAVIVEVTDVLCNGESNGEIIVNGVGGSGVYEFSMDGGAFVPSGTFSGLPIGTYDFEVVDENGCAATISATVNEPPVLTLDIVTLTHVTCFEGADGEIDVVGGGGFGALSYSIDGGVFAPFSTFGGLEVGTYTIVVRDENGCEVTMDITLNEPPAVDMDETVTDEICLEDCEGTIVIEPVVGVAPYAFSIDNCATSEGTGIFTGLCADTYEICVVDANGCEYMNTVTIDLGAPPSDATIFEFGRDFCADDDPVMVTADSPGGVYTGPGMVGNIFNPMLAGVGTHTITYTITEGCGDIGTYDLTVYALPFVEFSTTDLTGCEPLKVDFNYEGEPGMACLWNFGDGTSTTCGPVTHTYLNDDIYNVSLTVTTSENGCTATRSKSAYIEVYNQTVADFDFGPQPTTTLRTEIEFIDRSYVPDTWEWTFGYVGSSSEQNPTFLFPELVANHYDVQLIVETVNGCIDSITKTVIIDEEYLIYVPNTITPDGDIYNEVFKPYFNGIDIYNYSLQIYNRWGELIFESYDPSVGWNGTYGGQIVESGVYIWHISTDELSTDKKLEYHGHVTVLK